MDKPKITSMVPVFGIGSYDEAVAFYVDWLGFNLDWEWREAPGRPVIMAISRDEVSFMLNEHPSSPSASSVTLNVKDLNALAEEWNGRRPGSANVLIDPPYEFPSLRLTDPFGNVLAFQELNSQEEQESRKANIPKMRDYIRDRLAEGKPFPTPEEVREAIGPDLGTAIEVLNEFPGYGAAFKARRDSRFQDLNIEVVEISPQPVLVMERESWLAEIGTNIREMATEVQAHIDGLGMAPSGTPFMRFMDLSDRFTIQVGFPIDSDLEGKGDILRRELPGGRMVTALLTGSPTSEAWPIVIEYANEQGYRRDSTWQGVGGWEVYVSDPVVAGAEKAQTRLYLPLSRE